MPAQDQDLKPIHIIGGGMAGSEAAWQIARQGWPVILHEMRPVRATPAHKTDMLAELVCSNSFRSDDKEQNAVGLLHEEMRLCDSLIMKMGGRHAVPAGGALAVDRGLFSADITRTLSEHPLVTIDRAEVTGLPPADWGSVIIATGPLTSAPLAQAIREAGGEGELAFFDAIAPIVYRESINMDVAWFESRYGNKGPAGSGKDYINCPLDRDRYYAFIDELLKAEKTEFKDWEKDTPYFEGCMPIEVMAGRGPDTLRFGPMKPVGLRDPRTDKRPFAVVQLRQDNALGTLYNMVGFQTKMKYGEQTRVLKMIPGLEDANFARLGGLHRNTFINSPRLLDGELRFKAQPHIRFAGQITGCEGYVESAAVGIMAARFALAQKRGMRLDAPPVTTAMGALLNHITGGADAETFQPMNINFGLFPALDERDPRGRPLRGGDKRKALTGRALADMTRWLAAQDAHRRAA